VKKFKGRKPGEEGRNGRVEEKGSVTAEAVAVRIDNDKEQK